MSDWRKPIPCPECDNPEMNQGSITVCFPKVLIGKWCECGCRLVIASAGNKPIEVTIEVLDE